MRLCRIVLISLLTALSSTPVVKAKSITTFTDTVGAASATQFGRAARNGLPQDWAGDEPYPGILPGTESAIYHYKTYTFAASLFVNAPYLEITGADLLEEQNVFLSAYGGSYNPANQALHWLGDEGSSVFSPGVASFFEILLPPGTDLTLVVNTTDPNNSFGGVSNPYRITLDAYADSDYTEPAVTPEPSSFLLLGSGLVSIAALSRASRPRQRN